MAASLKAMLDSLMGKDRNAPISERKTGSSRNRLAEPDVCKYFLCGFCPHDLFLNTKVDLGHCDNVHDDALQEQWNRLSEREKKAYGYEERFVEFLQKLVSDMDRKIQRHRERMEEQNAKLAQVDPEVRDRLSELSRDIVTSTNRMEALSEEGDVDGAHKVLQEVEALKAQKEVILEQIRVKTSGSGTNRLISVCEICSAFTMSGDNEQRIHDHVTGKQHTGYQLMRETIRQFRAKKIRNQASNAREDRDKEKDKDKDKVREGEGPSSSSGSRDRDRDR
eukprot:RCo043712